MPLNNLQGTGGIAFNPLAYAGDKDKFYHDGSPRRLGVGGGFVLSAQYQF